MNGPASRRGFLRGLTALPLVGGGMSLIGNPVGAAVPVTDDLHFRYLSWLAHEHREAALEYAYRSAFTYAAGRPGLGLETPHEYGMRCRR